MKSPGCFSFCETGSEKCFGERPSRHLRVAGRSPPTAPTMGVRVPICLQSVGTSSCSLPSPDVNEWIWYTRVSASSWKGKGACGEWWCVCACMCVCVCDCVWADEILVICSEIFRLHPNDPALPHTVILRMGTCCLFKYDALLWLLLLWFSLICRSTCCIWTPSPRDSSSWLWGTRAPESHTEELAFWARLLSVIQWHLLSTCYAPGTEKCMTAHLPRGFCIVPWLTAGPKWTQPKV